MANFEEHLINQETGEICLIKSNDLYTFQQKKSNKLQLWNDASIKQERITSAKQQTEKALELIRSYNSIFYDSLFVDNRIDYNSLKDHSQFPEFKTSQTKPEMSTFFDIVPRKVLWEVFFKKLEKRRMSLEKEAVTKFLFAEHEYNKKNKRELDSYQKQKREFYLTQEDFNKKIDNFKKDFEDNNEAAIVEYVKLVLERSQYPDQIQLESEVFYFFERNTILINMDLPTPEEIPSIIEYKYIATKGSYETKYLKKSEQKELYENTISQICLKTIYEVFQSIYTNAIDFIVFNGYVSSIDLKTGNDLHNCIISVQAERDNFKSLNLHKINARECIKGLKGVTASEFINLAPIVPILSFNRNDKRIIEANNVIESMDAKNNLAEMDWQKFEVLIRDLFEKEFSGEGVEVKVTQASRDSGVDAIIFDPDPIKGGKFVIQAKRYNNVVGVNAVRDLYGSVMNEGAVKGILVTTSNYGKDSLDFANNKPLTLINGQELVYMFNKHGYKVNIKTKKNPKQIPKDNIEFKG